MDNAPVYARLSPQSTKWLSKLADKSGWSKREILDRLCDFGRLEGFQVEKKPVPGYLEKAIKKYKASV